MRTSQKLIKEFRLLLENKYNIKTFAEVTEQVKELPRIEIIIDDETDLHPAINAKELDILVELHFHPKDDQLLYIQEQIHEFFNDKALKDNFISVTVEYAKLKNCTHSNEDNKIQLSWTINFVIQGI